MNPCPFCGHPPDETVIHTEDFYAFVTCRNCGANGPSIAVFEMVPGSSSREEAVEAWDRRAMTCSVCRLPAEDGKGAYDEGDTFWCAPCMRKWEREHGRHWEDGTPMRQNFPTCAPGEDPAPSPYGTASQRP